MDKLGTFIKGKCMEMCPRQEMKMRENERLLHILEMVPVVRLLGKLLNDENNLRPPEILSKTISYLLFEVIDAPLSWHIKYEFIADRLRAVRQDMIIQNVSLDDSISLLQPIVRFYAYAAYKSCKEEINNFDPVLNKNQLQECLKKLLSCYDCYDQLLNNRVDIPEIKKHNEKLIEDRPEFEALYLIFNIGNEEALLRALNLPQFYNNSIVKLSFELSLAYNCNDFVKIGRIIPKLPTLLAAVASLHLPEIRRKALLIMCQAYHSQNLYFPLEDLQDILIYGSQEQIVKELRYYRINVDGNCVYFNKKCVIDKKTVHPTHERVVEDKLSEEIVQNLLLG